tara:strand:- start:1812 stop:2369 length:558 start_codon:yes stop_codon:yes gene_type:complete
MLNIKTIGICIIIFVLITIFQKEKYYNFYPTIPVYPNNQKEVLEVEKYIKKRNKEMVKFYELTNESIIYAYIPHVKETKQELSNLITKKRFEILFFKNLINRARPKKVKHDLDAFYSYTGLTPSYPAGHAYQAYYLTKYLSKRYPNKRDLFEKIAKKCDLCRVYAGIHYPSDGQFSKYLVDLFYN